MSQMLRQMGGEGQSPAADMEALFQGNPKAAMLATLLQQRNQGGGQDSAEDFQAKLNRSRRTGRILRQQLEEAAGAISYIAEVFGSCELCWGRERSCPQCAGAGGPGSRTADRNELLAWVLPALHSVGLDVVPLQKRTTGRINGPKEDFDER
ncbi:MAG: hypothetical protein WD314_02950 [Trueperaceae bacterium]